jgi:hypothetical protein
MLLVMGMVTGLEGAPQENVTVSPGDAALILF